MMRLPEFRFVAPRSIEEAVDTLASHPPGEAMIVAGGTDLLPNMKRRQQTPRTLVGLARIAALRAVANGDAATAGVTLGAGLTLTDIVRDRHIAEHYTALWQAASQVATPHLRNMGTLGGNICLDTRCNYYDQNYEWRKAIDFCMKRDDRAVDRGATQVCWVATSSPRCLAVSSTDTAPALMSLGAEVTLASAAGKRRLPLDDLYRNDGIHYLTRRPDELVTEVRLPPRIGWRSTYWKLRRRGSFDFPVLSVAAAVRTGADGAVEDARIVLGAVASRPIVAAAASASLVGGPLDDDAIARAAELAAQPARPMDNTDFTLVWRKRVTRAYVTSALRELRGDRMARAAQVVR
ncbi:MAG TPA: FAD binding domain-containing protein [Vicinamibacterales bacterium]|nr:FAD binding domain-containing protein [Vicinamibacterales bacterium]